MRATFSDILVWPNGVWCYREDSHGFSHMSDDYEVLRTETRAWCAFLTEQGRHEDPGTAPSEDSVAGSLAP